MKSEIQPFILDLAKRIQQQPEGFIFAAFSAPSDKTSEIKRVRMRPLIVKGALHFQISSFTETQCFSVNVLPQEIGSELTKASTRFSQA
ncbi:MAG: hypothetical protein JSS12_03995, partial [Verrucomicrobia bacterium]|nr:hypothetical protein [Verrucomicrobiota bacterium]